jgi:hypothetical protein
MGLFDVNMPILYGEGALKAFQRLQRTILDTSLDPTIFAWRADKMSSGLLSSSPADFAKSGAIRVWNPTVTRVDTPSMTTSGLSICLPLTEMPQGDLVLATLWCWVPGDDGKPQILRILLRQLQHHQRLGYAGPPKRLMYRRVSCHEFKFLDMESSIGNLQDISILEDNQFEQLMWIDGSNISYGQASREKAIRNSHEDTQKTTLKLPASPI